MDPIDDLITANPTPAVLHIAADPADYAPGNAPDLTLRDPEADGPAVTCLFGRAVQEDIGVEYQAVATFRYADIPEAAAVANLQVTIDDVDYAAVSVRKRYWEGVQNGWTLFLT